jgi:hypothetical protein
VPTDEEVLANAPRPEVEEHFRAKAVEQQKLREAGARSAAERMLLEWKG